MAAADQGLKAAELRVDILPDVCDCTHTGAGVSVLIRYYPRFQHGEEGTHVWEASVILCRYLIANEIVAGKTAMELGAGCGLTAIGLAKAGKRAPGELIVTDGRDCALRNLQWNILQNNLVCKDQSELVFGTSDGMCVKVFRLDWTDTYIDTKRASPTRKNYKKNSCTQKQNEVLDKQYDVIYASDVIYGGSDIQGLCAWVARLTKNDGVAYLCSPISRRGIDDFCELIESEGMSVKKHMITPEAVWPGDSSTCVNTMTHVGDGLDNSRKEFKEKIFTNNLSNATYVILECHQAQQLPNGRHH